MLSSLRQIVQEVNSAPSLQQALDLIVRKVRSAMGTEVCSVYMLDVASGEYVFAATEGLNVAMLGKVALAANEGLVGQVATREEPLNLDRAEKHPRFKHFPGIGEESFSSFLGVPIIHQRKVLGVLTVQQRESRRFDESEEAFLVTMSAQLAGVIAHAEATGALDSIASSEQARSALFHGVPGSPGVALGQAVVVSSPADLNSVPDRKTNDIDAELQFFWHSLSNVRVDIKQLGDTLAGQLRPEERALFDVYLLMLDDNALGGEITEKIRQGSWAQGAVRSVILEHVRTFERMEDSYLRERAADVRDLGRRVLEYLQQSNTAREDYPEQTVLIGEELTASMLGEVPTGKLVGLVSVRGSSNSHVAIMARAMGIPTVMGAVDLPFQRLENAELIIDGYNGEIYSNPNEELSAYYRKIVAEERQLSKDLEMLKDLPCETTDGHRIPLHVNTGLMSDVVRSLDRGAEGVGLYRTEVPFLLRDRFPSEEEQRHIYREQLEAFEPLTVTMRTLDIGGDKSLPYFPIEEENPFLGWRGIRVTLDHPEIFLAQVRAMLKASEGLNNLRIMLPMVTHVSEIDEAQSLINRAYAELVDDGYNIKLPPVGVMVEVPAAVYQARAFARRVDFLSVGSNDLTQYLLAVDRNNSRVAGLYHSYHPSVLQALEAIADAANMEGKPVTICGELAGEPGAAILLMAMGYDALSMNAASIPKVKQAIRSVSKAQAEEMQLKAMQLEDGEMIAGYVQAKLDKLGISQYLSPGALVAMDKK
ncbi:MAG: phosphoenolpyruvate--protein phosphotransferase [Pseudomonadales bacterium]